MPYSPKNREGNGNPLQYSCLENPMDGGAWWAAVYGVTGSRTRLGGFTFTFHFSLLHIGAGNGNPLQYSCLENARDGAAWWAAIYGATQSQTHWSNLAAAAALKKDYINYTIELVTHWIQSTVYWTVILLDKNMCWDPDM